MKNRWGCTKDIKPFDFYGEELKRCPRRPHLDMRGLINECIQHYNWLEKGHMPTAGTWIDQTPAYITFMETISHASSIVERELHKKQQADIENRTGK